MIYTIEETNLQRQQLLAQCLNPLSLRALDEMNPGKGAKILDLGCGLGETTRMLSKRFPGADLTGIDQDEALIDAAASGSAGRNPGITFVAGDALDLPFEDDSFDFVFTRYLLHHLPDPVAGLKELTRVCKRGGIVFAQEPDANSLQSYPESRAYPLLIGFVNRLFADALLGRKLIHYYKEIGLEQIAYSAEVVLSVDTPALKTFYAMTAEALGKSLLEKKLIDREALVEWIAELWRADRDPETIVLMHPTIAVWGVKP